MRETMCFDESAVRYDAESASGRKSNHGLSASTEMDPNDPRFDQLRATISAELDSVIEDLRGEIKSLKETQKA
ncbi:hypothetical protein N7456_002468 [Penicillium angulare]|uniref:Uncharacterized protein n=1 Tax=Penicillium angulare TaxID=116970 RepID=A0A9W9G852_9EURO|nr:hypothetical protein N7456_002468 [Penicillium angulare]